MPVPTPDVCPAEPTRPGDRTRHGRRRRRLAAVLGVAALVAAGCGSDGRSPDSSRVEVSIGAAPNRDVIALPGSIDAQLTAALDRLPSLATDALAESKVPGMAIGVVHGDRTVFTGGYGVRRVDTDQRVDPDTVFQIASVSKPLSATGVAAAIGRSGGALSWTTPVHELLPDFAFSDPTVTRMATIGDAFSHCTGLHTGAGDDLEDLGYDQRYIFDHLRFQPLDAFRASYNYSNYGLTIGAEAVAASRHQSWQSMMQDLVFGPLGMTSTSTRYADYVARPDRAVLHTLEDGEFVAAYDRRPDPQAPAGGVSSNVEDLSKWMRMLLAHGRVGDRAIADADALAQAMTPQVVSSPGPSVDGRPGHYGFGFNSGPQVGGRMAQSHSGAFSVGAATAFTVIPDLGIGIVVLTNGAPIGVPEAVSAQFLDLVQYGHITRDWLGDARKSFAPYTAPEGDLVGARRPAAAAAPPSTAALVGHYDNPYFGPLTVSADRGGLSVALGPDGRVRMDVQPWDGATFAYAPRSESAPAGSLASAHFAADGATVRLSSFDSQGLGTWTRRG
ncbi:serine hydrolase domain-containing protein [Gordonia aichiensis]|uniref:serine hydrolase domain-containing protein n=1 Tax=Gordonia aichiensis TaxID=36820 RepID=UPI0032667241